LIRGVYHYFRADRDGKTQAEHVLRLLREGGGLLDTDLPPVIDIEDGTYRNLPGGVFEGPDEDLPMKLVVEECLEFLEVLEAELNVRPIVYAGQSFHWRLSQARPELAQLFAKYSLWTPSYTTKSSPYMPVDIEGDGFPWSEWSFWQFTSKGESHGIEGRVDQNYFRGTEEDLAQFVRESRIKRPAEEIEETPCIKCEEWKGAALTYERRVKHLIAVEEKLVRDIEEALTRFKNGI
jgi:lysozyme